MNKLLYIHGFGSCGKGNKSGVLQKHFSNEKVFAPDLPFAPLEAIAFLHQLVRSESIDLLVGSSLGGYYATILAEAYALKAVLINPSTQPYITLKPYLGRQKRFCDDEVFEWRQSDIDALKSMAPPDPRNGRYLVLLQSGDEVLDFTKAQTRYHTHKVIVEYGGNHRFENLEDYVCMIENFWKRV